MRTKLTLGAALLLLAFCSHSLFADITVKSTVTSKGMIGLMNMEGSQQSMISGDKAKTASNIKMTSKVMKFLGAGKPQEKAEITRIDKDLFWYLEPKDKKYEEKTFAEIRAEMEKALRESEKEAADYRKKHPEDSVQLRTEVKVNPTGKTQKIAGYNAEQTIISFTTYAKNSESGEAGAFNVELDLWLSRDVPGSEEFQKFYAALAAKLGFTGHGQQTMEGALASLGIDPRELYKHTKDLQGMALMSTVTVAAVSQATSGSSEKAEVKETPKEEEQGEESSKSSKLGKLSGLLGKKKDKKSDEGSKEGEAKQSGPSYLMQFTNTVTEVSTSGISGSEFEVPADYKKK